MDEIFLLKKLELVNAIKPLRSEVMKIVRKINALRNALVHSFYPEHRKEFRSTGIVECAHVPIHTQVGLKKFMKESRIVFDCLYDLENARQL